MTTFSGRACPPFGCGCAALGIRGRGSGDRDQGTGDRGQGPICPWQFPIFNLQFTILNLQSTAQKKPREPLGPRGFWSAVGYVTSLHTTSDPAATGAKVKPIIGGQARTHITLIVIWRDQALPFPVLLSTAGKKASGKSPQQQRPPRRSPRRAFSPPSGGLSW